MQKLAARVSSFKMIMEQLLPAIILMLSQGVCCLWEAQWDAISEQSDRFKGGLGAELSGTPDKNITMHPDE